MFFTLKGESSANLDVISSTGFYRVSSSNSGLPSGASFTMGILLVFGTNTATASDSRVIQVLFTVSTSPSETKIYTRGRKTWSDTSWTDWEEK